MKKVMFGFLMMTACVSPFALSAIHFGPGTFDKSESPTKNTNLTNDDTDNDDDDDVKDTPEMER